MKNKRRDLVPFFLLEGEGFGAISGWKVHLRKSFERDKMKPKNVKWIFV